MQVIARLTIAAHKRLDRLHDHALYVALAAW